MTIIRHSLLVLLAGTAAGCTADADETAANTSKATAGAPAVAVSALPTLRPGLWRTTMLEGELAEDEPEEHCVGPGVDLIGELGVKSGDKCSRRNLSKAGDRYVFDLACTSEFANSVLKGSVGGDFKTRVSAELDLGIGVPGEAVVAKRYRYESRYVGACTLEAES